MRQDDFQRRHEAEWAALDEWLALRSRPSRKLRSQDAEAAFGDLEFARAYRRVCQQLAIAERRGYSGVVLERLRMLVHRGHLVLYRPPALRLQAALSFVASGFPRLVRAEWRAMAISALLLFAPMLAMIALLQWRPELVGSVFEPAQLAELEGMYDPDAPHGKLGRESGSDLRMFGYYVYNNVSIGFRTYASGLLAGIGPVFVLMMNGTLIGTAAGHLTAIGHGGPFWRFVVGHSAPELLAIVIAGGAGLGLGMALLAPGRLTRSRALAQAGAVGAKLVLGAFAMLMFAAFIEAYWSSIGSLPDSVKFGSGALIWLAMLGWLALGGRTR
ncbi:MAG TPA: stage II sporulation protein M [Candidatus Saccharimonadia bacterium]|nr:stage II sporulation protein M [Candidatus Saccharimonadia bacterium]